MNNATLPILTCCVLVCSCVPGGRPAQPLNQVDGNLKTSLGAVQAFHGIHGVWPVRDQDGLIMVADHTGRSPQLRYLRRGGFVVCYDGGPLGVAAAYRCITQDGIIAWLARELVDGPEPISLADYDAVRIGMTLSEVEAQFGGPGTVEASAESAAGSSIIYSWSDRGAKATVSFRDGRVESKRQYGLR